MGAFADIFLVECKMIQLLRGPIIYIIQFLHFKFFNPSLNSKYPLEKQYTHAHKHILELLF